MKNLNYLLQEMSKITFFKTFIVRLLKDVFFDILDINLTFPVNFIENSVGSAYCFFFFVQKMCVCVCVCVLENKFN